ncbi:MAG: DNA translocase FtsK 4TM domain-containing protein, partial [Endomicrobiia bacterium]
MRYTRHRGYFQVKTKTKKTKEIRAIVGIILGIVLFYCLVMPDQCGAIGKFLSEKIFLLFGKTSYILVLSIILISVQFLILKRLNSIKLLIGFITIAFLSTFLSIIKFDGGIFGDFLSNFFIRLFGKVGSQALLIVSILYFVSFLTDISLVEIGKKIVNYIIQDIKEWQNARKLIKKTEIRPKEKRPEPKIDQKLEPEIKNVPQTIEKSRIEVPSEQIPVKKPISKPLEEKIEKPYNLPTSELLTVPSQLDKEYNYEDLIQKAALLEQTLSNFNVFAKVTDIVPGPMVTRFDLTPEPGVKVQQITNLSNDIALAMKAQSVRIIAPVPGKGTVGVEIPNPQGKLIGIKEVISSKEFQNSKSKLTIALGKTADGRPYITDLCLMPHLLIAGATGSGKSVCIHTIITSILFKSAPNEVKFLLIDPKRLELPVYNGLPHLYDPTVSPDKVQVITNPKHAAKALKALVKVMEKRYEKFAKVSVRNIESYNEYILQSVPSGVISFDRDKKVTKVNSAAERILNIKSDDVIGKNFKDIFREPLLSLLSRIDHAERKEIQYVTDSGRNIYLGLTLTPLINGEGDVIGQIMVFTDLTDLKALKAQAELRDRLSSLGEMAAGIAHELRNPMGVIAGYTKILQKKVDPTLLEIVDSISKEIVVMDRIISDFLFFAKPADINPYELNLRKLIE